MKNSHSIAQYARVTVLGVALALPFSSQAEYPDKPITLVVPFAPGGNLDITARTFAPELSKALKVDVTVENKPGGGGAIGAGYVAHAHADGYTVLVSTPNAIAVVPHMTRAPYKPTDFQAIGLMATTPLLIEVNKDSRFKDFKGLLDYICANPGKLTVGHSGIGTTNYMGLIAMEEASKCEVTPIPYKGSGPALVDLLGGQIDAVVDQLSSSSGMIHSGKLRALAVLTAKRVSALPDVPTVAESGIKGIDAATDTGLLVAAKTPSAITERLNKAMHDASSSPRVQKAMENIGSAAIASTPDRFAAMITDEDAFAGKLSAEGKLKR